MRSSAPSLRATRAFVAILAATTACQAAPGSAQAPAPPMTSASASATVPAPAPDAASPDAASPDAPSRLGLPLTGPPRLVVENPDTTDLELRGAYLVDAEGKLGTMELWPGSSDCPDVVHAGRALPKRGVYEEPAPTRAFDTTKCAPGPPLPAGRYVVLFDGGYGDTFYAAAEITLPLTAPVRVSMKNHSDDAPTCTPERARRAARLALAAAEPTGWPTDLFAKCDVTQAKCGTLPLPQTVPPERCTLTLHENLLQLRRAPGGDSPSTLTAWLDPSIVATQRPTLDRTSADQLLIGGARVVFEGRTRQHMHEHGGAAAPIGMMGVRVHNPLKRALAYSVTGVEWLPENGCALPGPHASPVALASSTPAALGPGVTELEIEFASQSAYQAYCNRFASRVRLSVEGQPVVVTVEHQVTRIEPMRPDP